MDTYHETHQSWNAVAQAYQDTFMMLDIYNQTYDYILDALRMEHPRLLELGCGPGNIARYMLGKRSDISLTGIDIAPAMVELARANNPGAEFEVRDIRQIGTLTGMYDAIIAGFCVPYLSGEDCAMLIHNSAKLLNTNGLMYISFVEGMPENSGFQTSSRGERMFFYYHTLPQLEHQLTAAGFELHRVFRVEYPRSETMSETHTVIIAGKM